MVNIEHTNIRCFQNDKPAENLKLGIYIMQLGDLVLSFPVLKPVYANSPFLETSKLFLPQTFRFDCSLVCGRLYLW